MAEISKDTMGGDAGMDDEEWYAAKVVYPDGKKVPVNEDTQPRLYQLKKCVNRRSRITLSGNVLMNNAEEEKRSAGSKVETRHLGMIMVKPQHLVKLESETREGDAISFY